MAASYKGETGDDFDDLIDTIAFVTATGETSALADLYRTEDLAVPDAMIS
jgi:hypothetical protein